MLRLTLGLLEGYELELLKPSSTTYRFSATFPRAIHEDEGSQRRPKGPDHRCCTSHSTPGGLRPPTITIRCPISERGHSHGLVSLLVNFLSLSTLIGRVKNTRVTRFSPCPTHVSAVLENTHGAIRRITRHASIGEITQQHRTKLSTHVNQIRRPLIDLRSVLLVERHPPEAVVLPQASSV